MHPFLIALHLASAVVLLLWAVRMVRTGVERAYGAHLKLALRTPRAGLVGVAASGMGLAIVLQSSTAVGILAAGFAATGILSGHMGLAALVGADLGSALVVKVLSFDLSELVPVLLLVGAVLFLKFEGRAQRQAGRIVLGIGFILMSLRMIAEATEPLRASQALPQVVVYLQSDPLTAFVLAAGLAWLMHSSVAMVLVLMSFASHGLLPVSAAVPMVLGANLGGAVIAVWLTRGMVAPARRIPVGNLVIRALGAIFALVGLLLADPPLDWLGATDAARIVNFHLLFNLVMVLMAAPFLQKVLGLAHLLVPDLAENDTEAGRAAVPASALDRTTLEKPALALASATRELLRMGETVEIMVRPVMDLIDSGEAQQIRRLRDSDAQVNRLHTDIKLFLAEVQRGQLRDDQIRRANDLTEFAINLEHIGDLVAKTLLTLAEKKSRQGVRFSPEGWAELCMLHDRVANNMQLALNVLVSGDVGGARTLAREKEELRRLERDTYNRHMARLRLGDDRSIQSSNLHLETARALKEINSLLVTIAYPILAQSGELLRSRLALAPD